MNFELNEDGYAQTEVDGFKFEVITIGKSFRVKLLNDKGNTILGDACDVFEADHIIDQYVISKSEKPRAQFGSLYLAAASLFAAKGDVRYYLNGVYIEPLESGGVNLVGTDGHRMVVIHDEDGYANRPFIIRNHHALFSICKKRPKGLTISRGRRLRDSKSLHDHVSTVLVDGDMVYAMKDWYRTESEVELKNPSRDQVHSMNLECSWPIKEIDGRYPNWRRVIPEKPKENSGPESIIPVNPKYVGDLDKVQQVIAGKNRPGGVICESYGIHKAMSFRFMSQELSNVFAVIMPVRFDAPKEFVPDFCK